MKLSYKSANRYLLRYMSSNNSPCFSQQSVSYKLILQENLHPREMLLSSGTWQGTSPRKSDILNQSVKGEPNINTIDGIYAQYKGWYTSYNVFYWDAIGRLFSYIYLLFLLLSARRLPSILENLHINLRHLLLTYSVINWMYSKTSNHAETNIFLIYVWNIFMV